MSNIIGFDEYIESIQNSINEIIKDSTYPELSRYIEMLPKYYSEKELYSWGVSYINEFYKVITKLDDKNDETSEKLKHQIYILYLKTNYKDVEFSYEEFITFSKLLNVVFNDYDPNKERENDRHPYLSGNEEVDYIVNKIVSIANHSEKPNAYEVTRPRLEILLDTLNKRRSEIIEKELNEIDLDDENITNTLSPMLIKDIKRKNPCLIKK